jgi:hypothetical protein
MPRPRLGRWSTYTVLGFAGYACASVFGALLAVRWELTLGERLVALLVPPLAFLAVVTVASAVRGREWIVFYQVAAGVVAAVVLGAVAIGARVGLVADVAVLGVGVFLVAGRIGCHHVACCHGRPARRGVTYGPAHAAIGFWRAWVGRPLFPVQLVESAASLLLVAGALAASLPPGGAAVAYATGYAAIRFALELVRGDPVRPVGLGVSEAQWWSVATGVVCALAWPAWWTIATGAACALGAAALAVTRHRRELVAPAHLHELDRLAAEVLADPERSRRDSSRRVGLSCYALPDGRVDWVLSSPHPAWSEPTARAIGAALWPDAELVVGRTPGVIHLVRSPPPAARSAPPAP